MSKLPIPEPSPQAPSELAVQLLKEAKKLLPKSSSSELPDGICYALALAAGTCHEELTACRAIQQAINQGKPHNTSTAPGSIQNSVPFKTQMQSKKRVIVG